MTDTKKLDREYDDIKSGVEGSLDDAPSPDDYGPSESESNADYEESLPSDAESGAGDEDRDYGFNYGAEDYGQATQQQAPSLDSERIHEIVESIVGEKINEMSEGLGDLAAWKEKINNDIVSIKQEVIRVSERFEDLQNAVLGRVADYDKGIRSVHTEMRALEKVFSKIMEPLVANVKELSKITDDLKKTKKK